MKQIYNNIDRIIFSREAIAEKVKLLGEQITRDFQGKEIILIGILKSSLFFMADLMRAIKSTMLAIDFIEVSDYGDQSHKGGPIRVIKDIEENIENKAVVIVEDLVDTGLTIDFTVNHIKRKKPAKIKVCTLVNKESSHIADVKIDYCGFATNEPSLVGYGADYIGKYRHLPFMCTIKHN